MPSHQQRPSREERQRAKLVATYVKGVDKKYRTRQGKKIRERLEAIEDETPGAIKRLLKQTERAKPPRQQGSNHIYSGTWRSFEQKFAEDWWSKQATPWTCYLCKKQIDENGRRADAPSIEHRVPWATVKTTIETRMVCCRGQHWEVAFTKDVRAAMQDETNLLPAHQRCNSQKNGPKDTDSIGPQRKGRCPGTGCKLRKAK